MIVDLLRTISPGYAAGTVRSPSSSPWSTNPTVHHLVSTVVGELEAWRRLQRSHSGAFPGGSITGAPKVRAMRSSPNWSRLQRGVYCGSVGYISTTGANGYQHRHPNLSGASGRYTFRPAVDRSRFDPELEYRRRSTSAGVD